MIAIIVAIGKNGEIGYENDLLFNIKDDLKRFRDITLNHTIVMGRKTFESLPKMLPKRNHVVFSKNENYTHHHITEKNIDRISIVSEVSSYLKEKEFSDDIVFVIGGGEIYKLAMDFAQKLYVTHVDFSKNADTFFPEISSSWEISEKSETFFDENENCSYNFVDYVRPSSK